MGQYLNLHQRINEPACVVTLVGTQRGLRLLVGHLLGIGNHASGSFSLCEAACRDDYRAGNQAVAELLIFLKKIHEYSAKLNELLYIINYY
jgi:hypothetical protein